ncbi:hypothetical protein, partial [Kitasatospora sp. NPDC093558]|uniref:hypothetical protein n=1 Tax=Kitasatospora sp. NPDC093558 TaxID=3155201 RepID=UPI0034284229
GLVPESAKEPELLTLRTRALYLARAACGMDVTAVEVPYLTYESYTKLVDTLLKKAELVRQDLRDLQGQLAVRKAQELNANNQQQINDNIKQTGRLLSEYLRKLQEHQGDVTREHQRILKQRQTEYAGAAQRVEQLRAEVEGQMLVVNGQIDALKQRLGEEVKWKWVKFGVDSAKVLFAVGGSIANPAGAPGAVQEFAKTAEKLKQLVEVLKAIGEIAGNLYGTAENVKKLQDALAKVNGKLEMPATHEWDVFAAGFDAALEALNGDDDLRKLRQPLHAAFAILAVRGKAWVEAAARLTQLRQEIDVALVNNGLNERQKKRLESLVVKLNLGSTKPPETDGLDLIGLTGAAEFELKQTLAALGRTLLLQDGAVQYQYLGTPTAIGTFGLTELLDVMAQQQHNIIHGITRLQPPPQRLPKPITYRIAEVPVERLVDGQVVVRIPADAAQFQDYAMVRAHRVVARLTGVRKKGEGTYVIALTYGGSPFHDRTTDHRQLTFTTAERKFGPYVYERATGKPTFGDGEGSFDKRISRVTPFSDWKIGLPKKGNEGLEFEGPTVGIELDFHLEAQWKGHFTPALADGVPQEPRAAASSEADLVEAMYNAGSALNGWDAVLTMNREKVNRILQKIYKEQNPGGSTEVVFEGFTGEKVPGEGDYYLAGALQVRIQLGKPEMQFIEGQTGHVKLTQLIEKGTTIAGSKKVKEDWDHRKDTYRREDFTWKSPKQLDLKKKPLVISTIPLSVVSGRVDSRGNKTLAVSLELGKGDFQAKYIGTKDHHPGLDKPLKDAIAQKGISYHINSISLGDYAVLEGLKPTAFKVRTRITNAKKDLLQLFIRTNGAMPTDVSLLLNEPVPDGYDATLMINSKIIHRDIITPGINAAAAELGARPSDPGAVNKAWRTAATGQIAVKIKWPDVSKSTTEGLIRYGFRFDQGNRDRADIDMSGLSFTGTKSGTAVKAELRMKDHRLDFEYWGCLNNNCDKTNKEGHISISMNADAWYEVKVVTEKGNPVLKFTTTKVTPTVVTTSHHGDGPCASGAEQIKAHLAKEMKRLLPDKIDAALKKVTFQPASTFALQNLLFPAKNRFTFSKAYLPSDLLILGTLTDK